MITKENYIRRRRALIEVAKQDLIVITGTDLVQKSSDETYEFEQDGYFYYLTGINEPGWILVIDNIKGNEFLISTDESSYHDEVWESKVTNTEIENLTGIKEIMNKRDGWGFLRREITNYQSIGSIVPGQAFSKPFGMYINPAKVSLVQKLNRLHKDINVLDISVHIRRMRSVKDDDEVAEIRNAVALTKIGFDVVQAKLGQYENEAQVYADFAYSFLNHDSTFAYKPVIAVGANAATLHYKLNNAPIIPGQFLLIDAGAKVNGYCGDITRTFAIGEVSQRQKDVYSAVESAQAECIGYLEPGMSLMDVEAKAESLMGDKLVELGVIDVKLRKNIRKYYPHAIGHHLGVDVHDGGVYDEPLKPGAVITIEPGIYLPEEGIGVRIEDNILITDSGTDLLSKTIKK